MRVSFRLAAAIALLAPAGLRAAPAPDPAACRPIAPAEIAADLARVRGWLESELPARASATGADPLDYPVAVIHSGMLRAAAATGDRRFSDFTAARLQFIADALPGLADAASGPGLPPSFRRKILNPRALDDCGAMTAALIQARAAGVGPDLGAVITRWADYVAHGQFRLPDGTLARHRPQPVSLWSDDLYMGIPALARMGTMTGDRAWLDDAARNAVQLSARLFRPAQGLYAHGWNADDPDASAFFWARCNGWAMLAMEELLDALPPDHPRRPEVLALLRAQIRSVAALQSGQGLWHQLLDRPDSYLETSASAIFVYGIAHAANRGWINPVSYVPVAQAGWCGVASQIDASGAVEGICVATTFASDPVYYFTRPVGVHALHGYGPVLLAGSEMIRLLRNPAWEIRFDRQACNCVPRAGGSAP